MQSLYEVGNKTINTVYSGVTEKSCPHLTTFNRKSLVVSNIMHTFAATIEVKPKKKIKNEVRNI